MGRAAEPKAGGRHYLVRLLMPPVAQSTSRWNDLISGPSSIGFPSFSAKIKTSNAESPSKIFKPCYANRNAYQAFLTPKNRWPCPLSFPSSTRFSRRNSVAAVPTSLSHHAPETTATLLQISVTVAVIVPAACSVAVTVIVTTAVPAAADTLPPGPIK